MFIRTIPQAVSVDGFARVARANCFALAAVGAAVGCSQGPESGTIRTLSQDLATTTVPAVPGNVEAKPAGPGQITVSWDPSPGATSYEIYRSTTKGGEGTTPHATTTSTSFLDTGLVDGPPTVYYYTVAATNSAGTSAQSAETATPTPYPKSPGNGQVAGVSVPGGTEYYCKDALLDGFDWFVRLNGWFPSVLSSSAAITPTHKVVDMAYATEGTMTFSNVVVPAAGLYNIDFRYAFAGGLFGGVNNREMGLAVNGAVITSTQRFPITGSFETYAHSVLQAELQAGKNTIQQFAVSAHGVSRVDILTVTPATSSVPDAPTQLSATASLVGGLPQVALAWTGGTGTTAFNVYRGGKSGGESLTPIATEPSGTTRYVDTTAHAGATYYYNVAATNSTGISPDSNEVTVTVP
jgi:fibronectin type 3 domain-containing protein